LQVSWWLDKESRAKDMVLSGGMLHVQNRSRVPARNVYAIATVSGEPAAPLHFNNRPFLLPLLDIPPCSIATMSLPKGGPIWGLYGPWEEGTDLVYRFSYVIFAQGGQVWKMTPTSLEKGQEVTDSISGADVLHQSVITQLTSLVKIRDTSDCGSDG